MRVAVLVLIVGMAVAAPCHADRAAVVPLIFQACQNTLLADGEKVASVTTAGVTVDEVCRCQAPLFVSGLSDAQLAGLRQLLFAVLG
jgi:hypothetical protein